MGEIERRLEELGLRLEPCSPPLGNYLGSKRIGNLLYVSGRKSELTGAVGSDVSKEEAKLAARNTVLILLSIIRQDIKDLDLIIGVVKLNGFVRSAENFTHQPFVLDGASELLISLFGENGRHARTATGVSQLPFGSTVQLEMILEMYTSK
jgi:enamine deaminase RidA (YjgF/YER057c/UK114 family)